jgi:hypothetical protein
LNYKFKWEYRDQKDPLSITRRFLIPQAQKENEASARLSNSINGSSFWKCEQAWMWAMRGVAPTNRIFNYSNFMAASNGNRSHQEIQDRAAKIGTFVATIPASPKSPIERYARRQAGETQLAIEVDLRYLNDPSAYTKEVAELYMAQGFSPLDLTIYDQMWDFYRLGIRFDAQVENAETGEQMTFEVKNKKRKKFEVAKKWLIEYKENKGVTKKPMPDDLLDGYLQVQMQTHWMRHTRTGERPKRGMLYVMNRDDEADVIEWMMDYDPTVARYWLPKVRQKKVKLESGQDGIPEPTEANCCFCDYWEMCQSPDKKKHIGLTIEAGARWRQNKLRSDSLMNSAPEEVEGAQDYLFYESEY